MAAKNRDLYQTFLTQDPRLRASTSLWKAESSYSQAGPRPGVPVPSSASHLRLYSSGTQEAGAEIDILAIQGAMPGRSSRAGGFAWKESSDSANGYRGWEAPATFSSWEVLQWVGAGDTGYQHPHAVTLKTAAYRDRVVVISEGSSGDIVVHHRDPATGGWTGPRTVQQGSLCPGYRPCLVEQGDRLYALHWARGIGAASTNYYVRVHVSTDGGQNWDVARRYASIESDVVLSGAGSNEYNLGRIRAAAMGGQVMVVARVQEESIAESIRQWASSDLGTELVHVQTLDPDTSIGGLPELVAVDGRFVMVYAGPDATSGSYLRCRYIGSAFDKLTTASAAELSEDDWHKEVATTALSGGYYAISDADLAIAVDDAGIIWGYARLADSTLATYPAGAAQDVIVFFSDDAGDSWKVFGSAWHDPTDPGFGATLWHAGASDFYPSNFTATFQRGRVVFAHNCASNSHTRDNSLAVGYLGGYHNLTLPPTRDAVDFEDRATFAVSGGLPFERMEDTTAYAVTTAGTYASTISGGTESLSTGDGAGTPGQVYGVQTDSTAGDTAWLGWWAVQALGGAVRTQADVAVQVRLDDGTHGVEVSVQHEATGFRVVDLGTGSTLLDVAGPLPSTVREFRLGLYKKEDGSVKAGRIWYRSYDRSEDKEWTYAGAFSPADVTAGATNRVRVGHVASSGGGTQVQSIWYVRPCYTYGDLASNNSLVGTEYHWHDWASGTDNPDNLSPRFFSSLPVYVSGGVSVRAVDGPAFEGNAWTVSTRYEWPIERVFPAESRSPRIRWRSVDDSSDQTIAWAYNSALLGTDDSHPSAPLMGLYVGGVNWNECDLYYYTAGAWVLLTSFVLCGSMTGDYVRKGATIVADNANGVPILTRDELAGWDARDGSTDDVRRISGNSPGRFATGSTAGPRARIQFEGTAATFPASGTIRFCPREALLLFHPPAGVDVAGWKLVIPAQNTVEGYFEVGVAMLGPVHVAALPPAWGRSVETTPGWEREETPDRLDFIYEAAPGQRVAQVAWPDGIDTTQMHDGTAEPDYVSTTDTASTEGAAILAATAYDLDTMALKQNGDPIAWGLFPRSDGSGNTATLNRRWQLLYGMIASPIEFGVLLGDEATNEVMTVARLDLLELP